MNTLLRTVLDEPGRYVLVGLPCHIQGLRLAQRRSRRLRERVVLALGIFCGLTNEPRATEVAARQAGLDPRDLAERLVPGSRLAGRHAPGDSRRTRPLARLPGLLRPASGRSSPPRCRVCPDALAELADISVGDAWLDRFEGSDGVSDLIVRTPAGEQLLADLAGRLELDEASPDEMVASQRETYRVKRDVCRGRLWLRSLAGRPLPAYPGLDLTASPRDRLLGVADAAGERLFRALADRRFPSTAGEQGARTRLAR